MPGHPTHDEIIAEMRERVVITADQVADDMRMEDLGLDSLDIVEMITALEMKHGLDVDDQALCRIVTVDDLFREIDNAERAS